jgi:hypothetical protein
MTRTLSAIDPHGHIAAGSKAALPIADVASTITHTSR